MVSKETLIGQKFNNLTVIEFSHVNQLRKKVYLCKCDCGNNKYVVASSLKSGNTKTCGCQQYNIHKTHGLYKHPLYQKHADMKTRCKNPNNEYWETYGGRGISVCDEWEKFENFYGWAIGNGWSPGLSIERKDVNQGYNPDNCEFIPVPENSRRNINSLPRRNDGTLSRRTRKII